MKRTGNDLLRQKKFFPLSPLVFSKQIFPFFHWHLLIQARIVDVDSPKDLGPGESGQLLIRGPTIMKGYLGNPGATAATIDSEGWLHTGDIAWYDKNENFYITDRQKVDQLLTVIMNDF